MHKPPRKLIARNFPSAKEDAHKPPPPSLYGGPESAYRLAFTDTEFLLREDLRPVRMQLELLKPELVQQEAGIESTLVIYGSARIPSPEKAQAALAQAQAGDVVLIAGKGHESYQETAGIKLPFSDKAQAEAALDQGASRHAAPGGLS